MAKKTHSAKYELIKGFYDNGNWNIDRVRNTVMKGMITEAEFKEITGEAY